MQRSRGTSGILQKQSPRLPLHLKTTACSEANIMRYRSPRLDNDLPKKCGARVAELKTKLGQAQEELKKLKEQLAFTEAAKHDAQLELFEARKLITVSSEGEGKIAVEIIEEEEEFDDEASEQSMVVLNAPTPEDAVEQLEEQETEPVIDEPTVEEVKNECDLDDNPVVTELRARLEEKDKELQSLVAENEFLKIQAAEVASAKSKEDELEMKLSFIENELKEISTKAERLKKQIETANVAKTMLQAELRKLRVQTNQWRKAAETAAAMLAAGGGDGVGMMESSGRTAAERWKTSDKHLVYDMELASSLMGGDEGEFSGGKRRTSGIRKFGDLWKKKDQQK